MFYQDWKEIKKLGKKIRKVDDSTIWEVSKIIDKDHIEIIDLTTKTKSGKPIKRTLSSNSIGFSTTLNSFDIDINLKLKETIYAETKDKALEILWNYLKEQFEENPEDLLNQIEMEVVKENILK